MQPDRRRFHMTMPEWAERRGRTQASDLEGLFATDSRADGWAALDRQPLADMARPSALDDERVPVTRMATPLDLDAIARDFVADGDRSRD